MKNFSALCTILLHWVLEGGEGKGPETSHVHKITYGPLIDMALYEMCLMGANLLLGQSEGLGHESLDFHGPTLPMGGVMDLPQSNTLHTGPYKS